MPRPQPRPHADAAADAIDTAPLSESLRALARRGVLTRRRKGTQIITEGDVGDTLFIVLAGSLRAYAIGANGREVTYGTYGPGEYVGEMGLDGGPRSAHVEAREDSLCAMVTRPTLQTHLQHDPAFAFELLTKVIRRARAATLSLKQVALNDVYGNLRSVLLGLAQPQPDGTLLIDAAPTQLELSQQLGCSREMVNKLLAGLRTGGYLKTEPRRTRLMKPLPMKW